MLEQVARDSEDRPIVVPGWMFAPVVPRLAVHRIQGPSRKDTTLDSFPVRRVITPADFADAKAWMQTRRAGAPDHDSGTVRVLAVQGEFYVENRGGFSRRMYADANAVSFVDVAVRSLELSFDLGEPGSAPRRARFGFACRVHDPAYAARVHLTNLFPDLERYVAPLLGRRFGYRNHRVGLAELQSMIVEYCAIRPPTIRGVRARLAFVDLTLPTEGQAAP
ncbi:hypothetical protein ACQP2P_01680 [Dactylosporangium sp. CA-139114]|uniref:hypothetical protein n=1 Tax=Dactylosporangium sp. CA-139114 TaxID=3239931 RepID=UPI003D99B3E3